MSKILIGLCAFVMLTITPAVHADTVIITSGSYTTSGIFGGAFYTFTGSGFSLTASGPGGSSQVRNCITCLSGQTVGASTSILGQGLGSGIVTINGVSQPVFLLGTLNLSDGSFTLPAVTTNPTFTASFNLSGSIFGCPLAQAPFCVEGFNSVFSTQLSGSGGVVVHLLFSGLNANGQSIFSFGSITYTIENPLPEPLTITLLASGLIGLAAKIRRSHKKAQKSTKIQL
ncbi:MAG TPA: hypothetical protein VJ875_01150 [Pyrinomonadaceae bacterium]|nr:hypothetical protein [Pyrinomonadaceae bacterium]